MTSFPLLLLLGEIYVEALHRVSCERRLPKKSHFCQGNQNRARRSWRSLSCTCSTQHVSPWTFELLSHSWTLISSSSWQPDCLHFWFKRSQTFCQSTSFICMLNSTNQIKLTRILHLHKEGQIEDDICNLSLYKLCLSFFSSEHASNCYLNLCFPVATSGTQIDAFCFSFSLSLFLRLHFLYFSPKFALYIFSNNYS